MTTTNNPPGSVQRIDAPNTHGVAADAQPTRVNRPARGSETKAFFKTTEFIVFIVATVGVALASYLVTARRARRPRPGR